MTHDEVDVAVAIHVAKVRVGADGGDELARGRQRGLALRADGIEARDRARAIVEVDPVTPCMPAGDQEDVQVAVTVRIPEIGAVGELDVAGAGRLGVGECHGRQGERVRIGYANPSLK